MPKRSHTTVGLDIEPGGITAVQVAVDGRTVERAAFSPLEPGIVREGEIVDVEALSGALRALWKDNRGLPKRVRVGVASQKIVVRAMELPVISDPAELDTAVRFQAADQIPMPMDSAVLDHVPLDVVDSGAGPRQQVLLVAARREMIERILAAVRGAGLRAEGIDLAAFAMVRALHRDHHDEHVLYLAVGGLTNLAVTRGATCLFTRASAGGLDALAVELAERCALTLEHARAWLVHVGLEQPSELIEGDPEITRDARRVLIDGVRRIAADVRISLDFHAAQGAADARVARAVLTGAAASVPGFAAALSAELGMPVDVGAVEGPRGLQPGRLAIAAGLAVTEVPR